MAYERWLYADPMRVLERKQQRQAKAALKTLFGGGMDQEISQRLEELFMVWYLYELAYRPNLGAPRVSASCRGHRSTDVHQEYDPDESEALYRKSVSETIAACLDELPWQQRSAVGLHCAARHSGASVIRNPRMTIDEHHRQYQEGKAAVAWMPRMRVMLRR